MSKLNVLNGWGKMDDYFTRRSAHSFMGAQVAFAASGCGSSCGSDGDSKPASACGAGDDDAKPASACGAGDDPKPSACGSGCGAGDDK